MLLNEFTMTKHLQFLECTNHVFKKISEAFGRPNSSLPLNASTLSKCRDSHHVAINVPLKYLQSALLTKDLSPLLNIKTDSIIRKVSENAELESICFQVDKDHFVKEVLNPKDKTTLNISEIKQTVVVDYSSPNIAKPFHVGHLRSTIVGNFVANILQKSQNVVRLNYLGDWGTQIGYIKAGLEAKSIEEICLDENPVKRLHKVYSSAYNNPELAEKSRQLFLELEKGSEWIQDWEKIRKLTMDHLEGIYKSFGIQFDVYSFESDYRTEKLSSVTKTLESNKLTSFEDGCLMLKNNEKKVPLFKSDGSSLYLVRDIAAALDRIKKYKCDQILYVVDKSQSDHIDNLKFAISNIIKRDMVTFIPFGRIKGMSSRKGTGVFLEDVLHETVNKMAEQQQRSPNTRTTDPNVTKILGVSALIIYILRQRRMRDFNFTWENALQTTGDSGIKMQYTHCRLCSLQRRVNVDLPSEVHSAALSEDVAFNLIFEMARFGQVFYDSQNCLESSFLVSYLLNLCNLVSRCLKELPVKTAPPDLAAQRMLLFNSARSLIKFNMEILGLVPLEEM